MRIAVDAMGGDFSPRAPVEGAIEAARLDGLDIELILVGQRERIEPVIEALGGAPSNVSIMHAPQVIETGERPLQAVRKKPQSSLCQCMQILADGRAEAMVSAGNTGACVTSASLMLKRLPGVKRPGIITFLPTVSGKVAIIDVGANVKCRPEHLFQYGIMGSVYVSAMLGVKNPRIGVLNIGSEDAKGSDLVQKTHKLFSEKNVGFCGYVEGQDIFSGRTDVVVTEGFVGNVILKVAEGLADSFGIALKGFASAPDRTPEQRETVADALKFFRSRTNYEESGGAPLLGIAGICMKSHGRSTPKAITNAVKMAVRFAEKKINENIVGEIRKYSARA